MFDWLIVGAGFAGSVLAERIASQRGERVLLIDRRPHVGGNAYDRQNEAGLLIHQYGPHIFHTNSSSVFDYLSRFTEWRGYEHKVLADVDGKLLPIPINLDTINQLYGLNLTSEELERWFAERAEPVQEPGDEFLARATLALDKHGERRRGRALDRIPYVAHRTAHTKQVRGARLPLARPAREKAAQCRSCRGRPGRKQDRDVDRIPVRCGRPAGDQEPDHLTRISDRNPCLHSFGSVVRQHELVCGRDAPGAAGIEPDAIRCNHEQFASLRCEKANARRRKPPAKPRTHRGQHSAVLVSRLTAAKQFDDEVGGGRAG